ncbi:MFS transporter [Streptomyces phaeochromogenes]|uniref:MFS transporter n=1 Tax=Streptomyces phaeochromogenes TaxID=1923 RepID=UPI0036CA3FED
MSSSSTPSSPPTGAPPAAEADDKTGGLGVRFTLIVLALMWPTQLLSLTGLLGGNSQASVALHFRTTEIAWFLLVNALVATVATPFVVKFADFYGKRNVMIVITTLGLVGDVIAAVATNYSTVLIGRGIAGMYGPIGALAYASIRELFPPRHVGTASGVIGSGIAFVALGGPFLAGWLLDDFGFRGVLWALAAATAVGLLLLLLVVPETSLRTERTRIDWLGGVLLGGGAASVTYGVGKGGEWGWTDGSTLAFIVGGLLAIVVFVLVERKVSHPIFDMSMMSRRSVWSVILATSVISGTVYGTGVISQLLVLFPKIPTISDGLGMTATHFAIIGIPSSLMILAVGFGTGVVLRKVDVRLPLALGVLFTMASFLVQMKWHYTDTQLMWLGPIYAIGMGMIVASVPVMIIEAVTPEEQAAANGMQILGQGVATAVITQLVYVTLNHDSTVVKGTRFYLDAGYKNAFLLGAGLALLGLLTLLLVPRLKRAQEVETVQVEA